MLRKFIDGLRAPEEGGGEYRCLACGREYDRRRQVCPACESYRIDRTEW